ncbi:hypothetical protein [Halobacterium jilantaiense]|uniref:Uncharacterized protein n=1 Tax=Halobacterium jilantaiense TaxID=355548 RepID=A0A1I0Q9Z9_9EURY|nr:hypothetical protein [Halobacterium jilantaiense]SEW23713.1 hypothetical protein SAMN04487945_2409 [Halobacterium jilantaiense]
MDFDLSRRAALSALAAAGVAGVAGCTGTPSSGSDKTTASTTAEESTTTQTTEQTASDERAPEPADSPTAAIEAFVTAEDASAFQGPFHPLHPFSVEQLSREEAENLFENSTFPEDVTLERVDRDVTVDLVLSGTLPGPDTERSAIEDTLAGTDAAVVEVTYESETGTETVRFVTVEQADGWLILAQGVGSQGESPDTALAARVVSGVAFEPDQNAARVQFVSTVVADSVTVEAVQSGDTTPTSTPGSVSYLEVGVEPGGDEVVVSATVDGESRVVHRERFPESDRLVDDIEFVVDPETDDRDAIARVNFNDNDEEGRVRVVTTVADSSSEAEPVGSLNYLNVGAHPDGDEVVVSYPVGGDTEEIHRERFSP